MVRTRQWGISAIAAAVAASGLLGAASPATAGTSSSDVTASEVTVTMQANGRAGMGTVALAAGELFSVTTTGSAKFGIGGTDTCVGTLWTTPDGARHDKDGAVCDEFHAPNQNAVLVRGATNGTVVGKIGDGPWFSIGADYTGAAPQAGILTLAYNDDVHSDNSGTYNATVRVGARAQATVFANFRMGVGTVSLEAGELFSVTASGSAKFGFGGTDTCAGTPWTAPDGSRHGDDGTRCADFHSPNPNGVLVPGAPNGTLVGKIGDGPWFAIGTDYIGTAPRTGILTLAYNDDSHDDNSGTYTANISTLP